MECAELNENQEEAKQSPIDFLKARIKKRKDRDERHINDEEMKNSDGMISEVDDDDDGDDSLVQTQDSAAAAKKSKRLPSRSQNKAK